MAADNQAHDSDHGDENAVRPRENAPVPPSKHRSVLYDYFDQTLKSPYMRALLEKGRTERDGR